VWVALLSSPLLLLMRKPQKAAAPSPAEAIPE